MLLPPVLAAVWLGGWWLAAVALVGGLLALHELYTMARGLRPLVLAGFAGLVLALVGAQLGGPVWLLGGVLATVLVAFVIFGLSSARPPSAVAAMATTLLGVVWVGGGLGCLILVRDLPEHGQLAIFTVLIAVFADDTAAFLVGRTDRPAPHGAGDLAPESRGRDSSAARSPRWPSCFSRSTTRTS